VALTGAEPVLAASGRARRLGDGDRHRRTDNRLGNEHRHSMLPLCRARHQALDDLLVSGWRQLGREGVPVGMGVVSGWNGAGAHGQTD
jgi:hypothetical protein